MIARAPLLAWWIAAAATTAGAATSTSTSTPAELSDIDLPLQTSQAGLASIDSQIDAAQAAHAENRQQANDLARRLHEVEAELADRRTTVTSLDQATAALAEEVTQLHERLAAATGAMQQERQLLAARLRQLHEQGDPPPAMALITTRLDPWALLLDSRYQEAVAAATGRRIDRLTAEQTRLETVRQELAARQLRLDEERHDLAAAHAQLADKAAEQRALLAQSRRAGETIEEQITALEGDRKRLTEMVNQLAARPATAPTDSQFATTRGHLPWPLLGEVVAFFGATPEGGGPPANGIRIRPTSKGEVHAVGDGDVLFADWFEGYGLLLIVDHGSGYYSLYGHASGLLAAVGNHVHQGDAIADTAGPDSAPLYFEIRQDGRPIDPLHWLEGLAAVATTADE